MFRNLIICVFLGVLLLPMRAFSDESTTIIIGSPKDLIGTPWEGQKVKSGTKLITSKNSANEITRTLEFENNVTITEKNGIFRSNDKTRGGGINCAKHLFSEFRNEIALCHERNDQVIRYLDTQLEKIYSFIAVNNLTPISTETLKQQTQENLDKKLNLYSQLSKGEQLHYCENIDKQIYQHYAFTFKNKPQKIKEWAEDLDRNLSIPRPPADSFCTL